jgi:acyl dehydratase
MSQHQTLHAARTIHAGASIGTFVREAGFATWNRYAAVNDEFVPIHMDDEAGRAAGMESAFGMGNLQWAYLHNIVRQWAGDSGHILELSCQFRKPNLKGKVTATGVVKDVTEVDGGTKVTLVIWTEDGSGDKLAPGTAVVFLPTPAPAG